MVVPHRPTQSWWPYLTSVLIAQPVILLRTSKLLYLPAEPERIHPLSRTLHLLVCQVSGNYSKVEIFQTQLQTLSTSPGGMEPKSNMQRTCDNGRSTVVNKILILSDFSATVSQGINFLADLYEKQKLSYSALNTARSALSLVIFPPESPTFGNHPLRVSVTTRRLYYKTILTTLQEYLECSYRVKIP